VKEAGVTLRYLMLAENNYCVWAVKMKIFMCAQGVWAAVVSKGAIDEKMDQMALATIVQAVPEAVVMAISEKETAKEAWDALKEMNMGEDRVKKARVQTLKRELDGMYMGDSEKINNFALKVTTIVNEIRSLGTKVEENTIVEKLLHSVPIGMTSSNIWYLEPRSRNGEDR
jgi:rhamnogalacturonyl hydrolase YesR